jgi:hypothetical protein
MNVTFTKRHASCYDVRDEASTVVATIFKDTWGWMAQQIKGGTLEYIASGPTLRDAKIYVARHFDAISDEVHGPAIPVSLLTTVDMMKATGRYMLTTDYCCAWDEQGNEIARIPATPAIHTPRDDAPTPEEELPLTCLTCGRTIRQRDARANSRCVHCTPTHAIDAVSTADDWHDTRTSYDRDQYEEDRMSEQLDRWQVWYYSYLNRWVASLATTPDHAGGRVYCECRASAESFAADKNAILDSTS